MAPNRKSRNSTPASRVYRRSPPAPQQAQFPARRRTVKTYGRKSTGSSARSLRQQTLTQIDYVTQTSPQDPEDLLEPPKERPNKRRKTLGDTPNSSYRTQTLTQYYSEKSFDGAGGDENNPLLIKDSDDDDDVDFDDLDDQIFEGELPKQVEKAASLVPETPSNRKIRVNLDEVPSSQPTPLTPMLDRYSPMPSRSPLVEKSTNVDAPSPTPETLNKLPRNLVIQDSFSPSRSPLSSVPESAQRTPINNKPQRQPLAELPVPSRELGPESIAQVGDTPSRSGKENRKRAFLEIPDSDAESDALTPTPVKPKAVQQTSQRPTRLSDSNSRLTDPAPEVEISEELDDELSEDACPGTPTPLARKIRTELPPGSSPSVFEETPQKTNKSSPIIPRSIQRNTRRISMNTQLDSRPNTQPTVQPNTEINTRVQSQAYSQLFESQRVPLEIIRSLGRVTQDSDVLISAPPDDVHLISIGMKDYVFGSYALPPSATRCWFYTAAPVAEVKYMAHLGSPLRPGEIDSTSGVGNAEFNTGKTRNKFARKLIQVYQLNNPVPLAMMKSYGLGDQPPRNFTFVAPTVAGRLLGNLRCALFEEGDVRVGDSEDEDTLESEPPLLEKTKATAGGSTSVSAPQELEEPNPSDIIEETQIQSSEAVHQHMVIPASQDSYPRTRAGSSTTRRSGSTPRAADSRGEFALPALPSTATRRSGRIRNQSQRQQQLHSSSPVIRQTNYVRSSQATTASQASTPAVSPQKASPQRSSPQRSSLSRPVVASSESSLPLNFGEDERSPVRLASSQALMMDSLLVDVVRQPPVILDSDDDFDDEL
ncbi:hypothetical protein B0T16DRAFT_419560 [Cercophora newfieldiana]|uniref:Uncharacterized protein n=1 Tax=Cercophora newfieldiana TaxID=92897 RepID=A0AA39XVY5_9PEZI|nr:hypothetical protein B0T16DRAFT_419560 [Cercophora newfieldiana]